jgi:hypothetical protein
MNYLKAMFVTSGIDILKISVYEMIIKSMKDIFRKITVPTL